ncbi:hypothetical protein SDC9_187603 [bioreactor metagenome]|uniref:Uncharacterized protein n=1 Tax=bioreactor metagenome TaxID=1076179 RepID=A0A645HM05_9ZZZZ
MPLPTQKKHKRHQHKPRYVVKHPVDGSYKVGKPCFDSIEEGGICGRKAAHRLIDGICIQVNFKRKIKQPAHTTSLPIAA